MCDLKMILFFKTKPTLIKALGLLLAVFLNTALSAQDENESENNKPSKPEVSAGSKKHPTPETTSGSNWDNPDHSAGDYMSISEGWYVGADFGQNVFYGDVTLYNIFPKIKDFKKSMGHGYSLYFGKKFKFGLVAEAQGTRGRLRGEKRADYLYPRYFIGDFFDWSVNAKYNLSQILFRPRNDRKFFNRLTVYVTVGGGQVFFRSRLYKYAVNERWYLENTNSFTSVGIDSVSTTIGGGLITNKTKFSNAIIIPAGGKIHFKLNSKTDLALNLHYVTVFSDKMDSWERSWSHKDKYFYIGTGLTYNFGKSGDDLPTEERFLRPGVKSSKTAKINADDDAYDNQASGKTGGFFNRKKTPPPANSKADKDLEVKLKLYELQLKLFEMQYLLGGN